MKLKKTVFKFLSLLSLISFYVFAVLGLFITVAESVVIAIPESSFSKDWGFETVFIDLNIHFHHFPALYNDQTFRLLNLLSEGTAFLFFVLVLWYLHSLFRNIYKGSVFMYGNVSVVFRLGIVILVLGTISAFTDGLLESRVIQQLQIENADVGTSNLSYLDYLLTGIVLVIVSFSLKKAVYAVEENKDTI